jgi:hypothetical protein
MSEDTNLSLPSDILGDTVTKSPPPLGADNQPARSILALYALGAALVLGALGDATLRVTPWGLNVPIWIAGILIVTVAISRWRVVRLAGEGRWLLIPIAFFALAVAWRDSPILGIINILSLLVALALAAYYSLTGSLRLASLTQYAWAHILAVWDAYVSLPLFVFKDIHWKDTSGQGGRQAWPAVARGLVIVLPLLLLFGGLFMAADPVFERLVRDIFRWDVWEALNHLLLVLVWAFLSAGFLRRLLMTPDKTKLFSECPTSVALGSVEVGVILTLLDALFLTFVVIQFRYLFGGAEFVKATIGMGYSEYTRKGFFELATVTALVLITLLVGDWWRRKDSLRANRIFQVLAGLLVALVFVVMASAVQRMLLNVAEQGLSELRIYVTVFIGWMAVVIFWFAATALRGQRQRFAFGALLSGFIAVAMLNFVSPDAMIARDNLIRVQQGQKMDPGVIQRLSADGVPAACEPAGLPPGQQDSIVRPAVKRWRTTQAPDWRTFNWSRMKAREAAATCAPD